MSYTPSIGRTRSVFSTHNASSKSSNIKFIISSELYDALRSDKLSGVVESVSAVGSVKVKTSLGNFTMANAGFLSITDEITLTLSNQNIVMDIASKHTSKDGQETIIEKKTATHPLNDVDILSHSKSDISSCLIDFRGQGLMKNISDILAAFETQELQMLEMDIENPSASFARILRQYFHPDRSDEGSLESPIEHIFNLSKCLSWSMLFLPLKFHSDSHALVKLFIENSASKRYKKCVLECFHDALGSCVINIAMELRGFPHISINICTEHETPKNIQNNVLKIADSAAFTLSYTYDLQFTRNNKVTSSSLMSEIIKEYCVGKALMAIA